MHAQKLNAHKREKKERVRVLCVVHVGETVCLFLSERERERERLSTHLYKL
jgi:hypothetical protein